MVPGEGRVDERGRKTDQQSDLEETVTIENLHHRPRHDRRSHSHDTICRVEVSRITNAEVMGDHSPCVEIGVGYTEC